MAAQHLRRWCGNEPVPVCVYGVRLSLPHLCRDDFLCERTPEPALGNRMEIQPRETVPFTPRDLRRLLHILFRDPVAPREALKYALPLVGKHGEECDVGVLKPRRAT